MFVINTSSTRYNVVRDAAMEVGWVVEDDKRKPAVPDRYLKESEQHSINIFEKPVTATNSSSTTRERRPTSTAAAMGSGSSRRSSSTRPLSTGSSFQKRNSPSATTEDDGDEERQVNSDGEDDDDDSNDDDTGKGVGSNGGAACGMTVAQERYLWKKFAGSVFAGSGTALLRRRSSSSCGGSSTTSTTTKGVKKPTSSSSTRATPAAPTRPPQPSTPGLPRSLIVASRGGAGRYYDPSLHNQLYWTDMSVLPEKVSFMKPFQRLNHFPDMHLICRKMTLFVRLMKLKKRFEDVPGPYKKYLNFFPMSWSTKDGSNEKRQLEEFVLDLQRRKKFKTFIMKPNTGCQGKGILITRNPIGEMSPTMTRKGQNNTPGGPVRYDPRQEYVVQLYVHRPLLIEERKFDLRVYVLVTSLSNPAPQIFVHKEGLVRLASEPYSRPYASKRKKGEGGSGGDHGGGGLSAHLTNYAVSKAKIKEVGGGKASSSAGKGSGSSAKKATTPTAENGGTDPSPQNDDNAMFKRDFAFLETFVNSSCKQWVDPKARAAAAGSDGDDEEEDIVLPDGPSTTSDGAADGTTSTDKKTPSFSKSSSSGPSISSTPLELCEGITPFNFLMQQIDRAVVISILSALPDLQRSLSTASFRGSATAAPCLPLATSLTMAAGTPPPTAAGGGSTMDDASGGTGGDGSTPTSSSSAAAAYRTMPRSSYGGRPGTSSSSSAAPTLPGGGLAPYLSTRDGRGCFELLGYDVLIREGDGKVDIMEINHSPSLFCDSAFDQKIKQKVVSDTLRILKPNMIPVKKTATGGGGDLSYLNDVVLSPKAQRSTWDVLGSGATNFRQVHPVPNSITNAERALGEEVVYRHAASSGGPPEEILATPMAKYGRPFFLHAETSSDDSFDPFSPVDTRARLKSSLLSMTQLGITHDVLYQLTKHYGGGSTSSSAASRARVEQHAERQRQLGRELDPNACVIKYDPNAGHLGYDPSYTPYPQYCIWLRHLYDTIMVHTGVFPGY